MSSFSFEGNETPGMEHWKELWLLKPSVDAFIQPTLKDRNVSKVTASVAYSDSNGVVTEYLIDTNGLCYSFEEWTVENGVKTFVKKMDFPPVDMSTIRTTGFSPGTYTRVTEQGYVEKKETTKEGPFLTVEKSTTSAMRPGDTTEYSLTKSQEIAGEWRLIEVKRRKTHDFYRRDSLGAIVEHTKRASGLIGEEVEWADEDHGIQKEGYVLRPYRNKIHGLLWRGKFQGFGGKDVHQFFYGMRWGYTRVKKFNLVGDCYSHLLLGAKGDTLEFIQLDSQFLYVTKHIVSVQGEKKDLVKRHFDSSGRLIEVDVFNPADELSFRTLIKYSGKKRTSALHCYELKFVEVRASDSGSARIRRDAWEVGDEFLTDWKHSTGDDDVTQHRDFSKVQWEGKKVVVDTKLFHDVRILKTFINGAEREAVTYKSPNNEGMECLMPGFLFALSKVKYDAQGRMSRLYTYNTDLKSDTVNLKLFTDTASYLLLQRHFTYIGDSITINKAFFWNPRRHGKVVTRLITGYNKKKRVVKSFAISSSGDTIEMHTKINSTLWQGDRKIIKKIECHSNQRHCSGSVLTCDEYGNILEHLELFSSGYKRREVLDYQMEDSAGVIFMTLTRNVSEKEKGKRRFKPIHRSQIVRKVKGDALLFQKGGGVSTDGIYLYDRGLLIRQVQPPSDKSVKRYFYEFHSS